MAKQGLTVDDMRALYELSKRQHTEEAAVTMMFEWMELAVGHIATLRQELSVAKEMLEAASAREDEAKEQLAEPH